MSAYSQFLLGFSSFFKSTGYIFSKGKWWWYIIPLLVWLMVFTGFTIWINQWVNLGIHYLVNDLLGIKIPEWNKDQNWVEQFKSLFVAGSFLLVSFAIKLFSFMVVMKSSKYFSLMILSPFLAFISEKTDEWESGKSYPFSAFQLMKDALRGVAISLRNLFIELGWIILLFILSLFIPFLAPVFTLALFIINAYFMGFSMFDYAAERNKLGVSSSIKWMRLHRWFVIGNGVAFNLVSLIPIASWMIAPVNGAVGATLVSSGKFGD